MKYTFLLLLGLGLMTQSFAQVGFDTEKDSTLIQFSGMVLTGSGDNLEPIPYSTLQVVGESRGTYSNYQGFFSIVVRKGDVIRFTSIGFKPVEFTIPDTLKSNRYSVVQLMTADAINLPETVIFPWPDREHFKLEFLAMDVETEFDKRAKENIAEERLAMIRKNTKMDSNENADYFLRQEAQSFYYIGQQPPMNIFNPIAWGQFFQAWKNGDFKKK